MFYERIYVEISKKKHIKKERLSLKYIEWYLIVFRHVQE